MVTNIYSKDNNLSDNKKESLILLPLYNLDKIKENEYISDILNKAIKAELLKNESYKILEDDLVNEKIKISNNEEEDLLELKKISLKLSADIIITGNYTITDEKIIVNIIEYDALKNIIIIKLNVTGELGIDLLRIADDISKKILEKITIKIDNNTAEYFVPRSIILLPITIKNENEENEYISNVLKEAIKSELVKNENSKLLNENFIKDKLSLLNYEKEDFIELKKLKHLALILSSDIIITGNYTISNEKITVNITAYDIINNCIINKFSIMGELGIDFLRVAKDISAQISTKIISKINKIEKSNYEKEINKLILIDKKEQEQEKEKINNFNKLLNSININDNTSNDLNYYYIFGINNNQSINLKLYNNNNKIIGREIIFNKSEYTNNSKLINFINNSLKKLNIYKKEEVDISILNINKYLISDYENKYFIILFNKNTVTNVWYLNEIKAKLLFDKISELKAEAKNILGQDYEKKEDNCYLWSSNNLNIEIVNYKIDDKKYIIGHHVYLKNNKQDIKKLDSVFIAELNFNKAYEISIGYSLNPFIMQSRLQTHRDKFFNYDESSTKLVSDNFELWPSPFNMGIGLINIPFSYMYYVNKKTAYGITILLGHSIFYSPPNMGYTTETFLYNSINLSVLYKLKKSNNIHSFIFELGLNSDFEIATNLFNLKYIIYAEGYSGNKLFERFIAYFPTLFFSTGPIMYIMYEKTKQKSIYNFGGFISPKFGICGLYGDDSNTFNQFYFNVQFGITFRWCYRHLKIL